MSLKGTVTLTAVSAVFLVAAGLRLAHRPAGRAGSEAPLTAVVELGDLALRVDAVGELDAQRATHISSPIRGETKIVELIEDGARVSAGDVLVRLDPGAFEDKVAKLTADGVQLELRIEALRQQQAWETEQAGGAIRAGELDLRAAELDRKKLEKGDGPLELGRLAGEASQARQRLEELEGYIGDLIKLEERGFSNPAEIAQAQKQAEDARRLHAAAELQFDNYRKHVLPTALEKADAQVARVGLQLEQTGVTAGYKVGKALAELKAAERELSQNAKALAQARDELAGTVIRAPSPGMAVLREEFRGGQRRKPRVGDTVWHNQTLVYLPDVSRMLVKTAIREVDLHKLEIGTPSRVEVDAYPQLALSGQVSSIGVLAEARPEVASVDKSFSVLVQVSESDTRLRPGMTARVTFLCAELSGVLMVPLGSVFDDGAGSSALVYVRTPRGRFEPRRVVLGMQNEQRSVVASGLAAGEHVALARPPAELIDAPDA